MAKTRKRTRKQAKTQSTISPVMIGAVVVAAMLVVGGLILLGNQATSGGSGSVDDSQFPTLGEANAPVTLLEYSDYG